MVSWKGWLCGAISLTTSLYSQYIPPAPSEEIPLEQRIPRLERAHEAKETFITPRMADVYTYGAFLYWQPYIPNFVFATTSTTISNVSNGVGNLSNNTQFDVVSFGYKPGVRVGIGKIFVFDYWSLNLEWTRLHAKGYTSQAAASTNVTLFEVWSQTDSKLTVQTIKAVPQIEYDMVEMDLIRSIWFSKYFALGLILGVEGIALNESVQIDAFSAPSADNANHFTHLKNDFLGAGSSIGIDANFYVGKGFSVFGFGKTALYVGRISSEVNDLYTVSLGGAELAKLHRKNRTPTIQSSYQTNAGLEWKGDVNEDKVNLAIWAAFEMNFFQTQVKLRQFVNLPSSSLLFNQVGDVGLEGFNLGAKLTF